MLKANLPYEKIAWLFTMQGIGQTLRDRYEAEEVPPELRWLVEQIGDETGVPSGAASRAKRDN
jgi:hypothetical protein